MLRTHMNKPDVGAKVMAQCSKQARAAWNNGIGPQFYFVGFRAAVKVMAQYLWALVALT